MNQKIFVISGLGADHTVFEKLELPGYEMVHIQWVPPERGDTLSTYAEKLLPQIEGDNPIVMGLSLGGMLALEISQLIPTKKVISISSIVTYKELPLPYRISGKMRLHRTIPKKLFAKGNRFNYKIFGAKTEEDKALLHAIFKKLDPVFLDWAVDALLKWDRRSHDLVNLFRIHGMADLVLPRRKNSTYDVLVEEGTHLMVFNRAEEVSHAILGFLEN